MVVLENEIIYHKLEIVSYPKLPNTKQVVYMYADDWGFVVACISSLWTVVLEAKILFSATSDLNDSILC